MTAILFDYWRSSSAYRVRIALNLLGVPYQAIPVNLLTGAQATPEALARNPQGRVPVLEIDGLRLTQSLAIVEYLDETRGGGLLPADPPGRARVRALAHAIAMEIQPICNSGVARYVAEASGGRIETGAWMRHFIEVGLAAVEALLRQDTSGRFCHGDTVSLADVCLVPQVYNARRWGVDLDPLPRLRAVEAALAPLSAVADAHPDRQADARPD